MKKITILLLLLLHVAFVYAQTGSITGTVKDTNNELIIGATVIVSGTEKGTITDVDGAFQLDDLPLGEELKLQISFIGYNTHEQNLIVTKEPQTIHVVLEEDSIVVLEGIVVTAQKREEQFQDVPIAISVLNSKKISNLGLNNLDELSDFVPGLNIQVQSNQRPGYVIRGITSDGNDPNSQPRVSVYYDNVPINRASGAVVEPYDMQRVEVVKGPQGTLFGRGAQVGAVHFIPNKPKKKFDAGVKLGYGAFNSTNLTGFMNIPITPKLHFRTAGTYDKMDGFVNNTFGGKLNGKNTIAGRAFLRYLPTSRLTVDLMYDYQNDDAPGVAFVTKNLANTNGESGVYLDDASLEQGEKLKTSKTNRLATMNLRYKLNNHSSLSSITSYRWHEAYERYDGDGSAARVLDFSEENKANQFYQELRLNSDIGKKVKTIFGGSYFIEDVDREFIFRFDEQSVAMFFFTRDPSQIVDENGLPNLIPVVPNQVPGIGGTPLPRDHAERRFQNAINSSVQFFIDGTWDITPKLTAIGGLRYVYDNISIKEKNEFVEESDPSVLGILTSRSPNLFTPIIDFPKTSANSSALTGRLVLKYKLSEESNAYASYSKGRRPEAIEFRDNGTTEILKSEEVNNYEVGYKTLVRKKTMVSVSGFYQDYSNFRTTAYIHPDSLTSGGTPETFQSNAGKASAYGIELDLNTKITKSFSVFGNYNYIKARFADKDSEGKEQEYSGNQFRLTPDHSFAIGVNLTAKLSKSAQLFFRPSYTYKSKHFFDDSNPVDESNPDDVSLNANQYQNGFGLLNTTLGVELPAKGLTFTLFGKNLLDEEYVIDAGNTGAAILGQATYVRGKPRIIGLKVSWNLTK